MADGQDFKWDFFLAHAGPDKSDAEALYDLLVAHARPFVDSRNLLLGDDWDLALPEAQENSLITVVLISSHTDKAYYQREEIANAIAMAREDATKHRVVPVYLDGPPTDLKSVPYGLRVKNSVSVTPEEGLSTVATRLINLLQQLSENPL